MKLLKELAAMLDMRDHEGRSPLMIAAFKGNVEVMNELVRMGADVKVRECDWPHGAGHSH